MNNYLINSNATIRDAIKQMDTKNISLLIVKDFKKNFIIGVFTLGDFRKAVLKGIDINSDISKILNKKFVYIQHEKVKKTSIKKLFKKNTNIDIIPILDSNFYLIDLISREDYFLDQNKLKNLTVVIMAGGYGKRLEPITKILPKALVPIGGKPIIELIIDRFAKQNFKKFIISINKDFRIIKNYLGNNYLRSKIKYVSEKSRMGTIGSLKNIKNLESTFILSNCDILIKSNYSKIIDFHKSYKNKLTIVSAMKNITLPYGVCELDKKGVLKNINEKPEFNYLINTGFYILDSSVIKLIGPKIPFDMNELINKMLLKKMKIGVYPISDKSWIDIGEPDKLLEAEKEIGEF